ncbi:MAG: hypothetical protein V1847_04225 [Candidatus Diapherotrites archaeon]
MKALVPLLSREENAPEFLEKLKTFDEIVLFVCVDRGEMVGEFGFAASDMLNATKFMEEMVTALRRRRVKVVDVLEWGETIPKIVQLAQSKQVDKVLLKKQSNLHWRKLEEELERKLGKKLLEVV